MRNVKYISAKKGQTAIVVGIILFHIVIVALAYFLLFDTSIINFEKIAVFLCSGNMIKKSVWKLLWRGFLLIMGIGFIDLIITGPAPGTPKYSHDNGPVFVYTLNGHNSPGSHGYWW